MHPHPLPGELEGKGSATEPCPQPLQAQSLGSPWRDTFSPLGHAPVLSVSSMASLMNMRWLRHWLRSWFSRTLCTVGPALLLHLMPCLCVFRTDSCTVLGGAVSHHRCTPASPVKTSKCYLCMSPVSHQPGWKWKRLLEDRLQGTQRVLGLKGLEGVCLGRYPVQHLSAGVRRLPEHLDGFLLCACVHAPVCVGQRSVVPRFLRHSFPVRGDLTL